MDHLLFIPRQSSGLYLEQPSYDIVEIRRASFNLQSATPQEVVIRHVAGEMEESSVLNWVQAPIENPNHPDGVVTLIPSIANLIQDARLGIDRKFCPFYDAVKILFLNPGPQESSKIPLSERLLKTLDDSPQFSLGSQGVDLFVNGLRFDFMTKFPAKPQNSFLVFFTSRWEKTRFTYRCSEEERVVTAIVQCSPSTKGALLEVLSQDKLGFLQDPFAILLAISALELRQSAFRISEYQGSLSKMASASEDASASSVCQSLAGPSTRLTMHIHHERSVLTSIDKILRQVLSICESNLKAFKYQISKHVDGKMKRQTSLNLGWCDRLRDILAKAEVQNDDIQELVARLMGNNGTGKELLDHVRGISFAVDEIENLAREFVMQSHGLTEDDEMED